MSSVQHIFQSPPIDRMVSYLTDTVLLVEMVSRIRGSPRSKAYECAGCRSLPTVLSCQADERNLSFPVDCRLDLPPEVIQPGLRP